MAARTAGATAAWRAAHPRPGYRRRPPPPPIDRRVRRNRSGPVGSDALTLAAAEPRRRPPHRGHADRPARRDVRRRPRPRRHLLHDHGGGPSVRLRDGARPPPPRRPVNRRARRLHRDVRAAPSRLPDQSRRRYRTYLRRVLDGPRPQRHDHRDDIRVLHQEGRRVVG